MGVSASEGPVGASVVPQATSRVTASALASKAAIHPPGRSPGRPVVACVFERLMASGPFGRTEG
jgi:hypothetical protein